MLYKEKITQSQQYNNKGRKGETTIDVLVGWALENPWSIGIWSLTVRTIAI